MEIRNLRPTNRGKVLLSVIMVMLLTLGYLCISWYIDVHNYITTDNAKVAGDILNVSPRITGKIATIKVKSGDTVRKGDILFTLETDQIKVQIKQAKAAYEIAVAEFNKAKGGARNQEKTGALSLVDQARAVYVGAISDRDSMKATLLSMENTYSSLLVQMKSFKNPSTNKLDEAYGMKQLNEAYMKKSITDAQYTIQAQGMRQFFVSKLQLETQIAGVRGQLRSLVANVEASRAGLEGAKSKYNLISEGTSSEDLDILESTVNAAQATYELAKLSLEYANVRAPQNGTIVQMTSHVGDVVTPGLSEMSLMDITKLTVIAYVLETELKDIKVGNQVKLSIDSFPGKTFKGTVQEVGEATSSVFTLFSSDNSSGNYAKVSQRVPIKITFDYIKNPVIPGMSTTAKIKITK